ncbi:MAG: peptidase S8, partial [Pseudomonadota bacterium]
MIRLGKSLAPILLGPIFAIAGCASVILEPPPRAAIERDADVVVDDRQIIAVTPTATAASTLKRRASRRGYRLYDERALDGLDVYLLAFRIPDGVTGAAAIKELETLEPDATAGVNHRYTLQSSSPSAARRNPRTYANEMLGWPALGCAAHVSVGVIDAAIDETPFLENRTRIINQDFTGGAGATGKIPHATAIATLLAGDGRLNSASIYNAAVIADSRGNPPSASVDAMMRALNWMQVSGVKLVNISLAGPYNKILERVRISR